MWVMRYGHIQHGTTLQKGKSIITCNKQCDCTPVSSLVQIWRCSLWGSWAEIQLTCPSHPCGFSVKAKREQAWVGSCLWKVRAGSHTTSRVREKEAKQRQPKPRGRQTKKIPPGSQIVEWYVLRQGRRTRAVALPKINRGYIWTCVLGFWVW